LAYRLLFETDTKNRSLESGFLSAVKLRLRLQSNLRCLRSAGRVADFDAEYRDHYVPLGWGEAELIFSACCHKAANWLSEPSILNACALSAIPNLSAKNAVILV
jgi:hypothetical protein